MYNGEKIDLDVVIADQVSLDAVEELTQLCLACRPLCERCAMIISDGIDSGDVVLESLLQLSTRYQTTSPHIVDSVQVLTGRIDPGSIAAAGSANGQPSESLEQSLGECVRYAAVVDIALQRRRLWQVRRLMERFSAVRCI